MASFPFTQWLMARSHLGGAGLTVAVCRLTCITIILSKSVTQENPIDRTIQIPEIKQTCALTDSYIIGACFNYAQVKFSSFFNPVKSLTFIPSQIDGWVAVHCHEI